MTRTDFARILLAVRRKFPVDRAGVCRQWSIDADKPSVARHIRDNIAARQSARRKCIA